MPDPLQFVENLARETGELLQSYFKKPDIQTKRKRDFSLVTEADLAADRHVFESLRAAFPSDHVLSEEHDTTFPADGRPTWVIDPLDGTTNFNQGIYYWGVSIARIVKGYPEVAGLSFPMLEELFTAEKGKGAFLNGHPLRVPALESQKVRFFTADSRLRRRYKADFKIKPRILGSAAYNLCAVATGVSILGFESVPKIWDIAASWLVLEEAGGRCVALKDNLFPMAPGQDYDGLPIPILGAANPALAEEGIQKITFKEKQWNTAPSENRD